MKKNDRISDYIATLPNNPTLGVDPRYQGFFTCFNRGDYFEAHDVLEDLWLQTTGPDYAFFKGLIQIAGAFVHLRKHHLRPGHPKDGRRLHPSARLFRLGRANIAPFLPRYRHLDTAALCAVCDRYEHAIVAADFAVNPWRPDDLPKVSLKVDDLAGERGRVR